MSLLAGCVAAMTSGILFSWTSPSIPILISPDHPYHFTLEQCSYLAVIQPIAAVIGSFFYGKLADAFGRKLALLSMIVPQASAFICTALAKDIYVFYLARVLSGLAESAIYTALPTYVGEISSPKVRGFWGGKQISSIYLGYLVINIAGGLLDIKTTAWVCLIFPAVFGTAFSFMPESPYYLLMKGDEESARQSLRWFRRLDNVDEELATIKAAINRQMSESAAWKDLISIKSNRRALAAGFFLRIAQQFSGCSSFAIYTQYIFLQAGGKVSPEYSSIAYTGAVALANFVASFTVDKLGRRPAILFSLASCSLVLAGQSVFFYVSSTNPAVVSGIRWFPLAGMILFVATFAVGLGIAPSLMMGELFSASVKAKALGLLNLVLQLSAGFVAKLFHLLETSYGMYVPFAVFGACCFLNSFVAYLVIPETKGKTLEEIQLSFKGRRKDMFK